MAGLSAAATDGIGRRHRIACKRPSTRLVSSAGDALDALLSRGRRPVFAVPLFLATLTMAGVCYGYLRLTTGSVWPAAIAHSAFNIFWDRLNAFTQTDSKLALEYLAGESGLLTFGALTAVAAVLAYRLSTRRPAPA